MFYGSFPGQIRNIDEAVSGHIDQLPLTVIIGVMWFVTILGFALALIPLQNSNASSSEF